jgi:hypothetical protein
VFRAECCWFCGGDMCVKCWDDHGHCGHPEADAINAAARRMTPGQRGAMERALQLMPAPKGARSVVELPEPIDYDEN